MLTTNHTQSGIQIHQNVLSPTECDRILDALLESKSLRSRAGARHLMSLPHIAALARDSRLLDIAKMELGKEAIPFRATLFEKSGKANWLVVWHQDRALPLKYRFVANDWGPWSCKSGIHYAHAPGWALSRIVALRIHLDASTAENGPLRMVPDTHQLGVLTDEEIASEVKQHGFTECHVPLGGVLAMPPLIIHSSSKARTTNPRRVLHIEYSDALVLFPGIELAVV